MWKRHCTLSNLLSVVAAMRLLHTFITRRTILSKAKLKKESQERKCQTQSLLQTQIQKSSLTFGKRYSLQTISVRRGTSCSYIYKFHKVTYFLLNYFSKHSNYFDHNHQPVSYYHFISSSLSSTSFLFPNNNKAGSAGSQGKRAFLNFRSSCRLLNKICLIKWKSEIDLKLYQQINQVNS